ncbi:hypothetical protein ABT158_34705 [Nonomuraea sp. NPDC001636]|uniref:hypothetical protein n=1 Tax=Nonomuraea sp. NPDC001636 TaxID=3154391 RepID=UPI003317BD29
MQDAPVTLPVTRPAGCPFDPPAGLAELRGQAPVIQPAFPDGTAAVHGVLGLPVRW